MSWHIHQADVLDALRAMPDNHYDACFSDVPYGLGSHQPTPMELCAYIMGTAGLDVGGDFMLKDWEIPSVAVWREIVRVVKPGAPVLSFAGSRTCDLISIGMRAAGLELRDTIIHYVYPTGFPKSLNISKAIDAKNGDERPVVGHLPQRWTAGNQIYGAESREVDERGYLKRPVEGTGSEASAPWSGHGTTLKPAYEPCVVAMKSLDGTFAENALKWGVGGLAIDACRIEGGGPKLLCENVGNFGENVRSSYNLGSRKAAGYTDEGRWPANITLSEEAGVELDAQSGDRPGMSGGGGASRFFFCAKASRFEREFGCEELPLKTVEETVGREEGSDGAASPRAGAGRTSVARNNHPCVKPLTLTQYLGGIVLPPRRTDGQPRRILVPYAGSGSEMIGALRAGWDHVDGIEREADYVSILRARIDRWLSVPKEMLIEDALSAAERRKDERQATLFEANVCKGRGAA